MALFHRKPGVRVVQFRGQFWGDLAELHFTGNPVCVRSLSLSQISPETRCACGVSVSLRFHRKPGVPYHISTIVSQSPCSRISELPSNICPIPPFWREYTLDRSDKLCLVVFGIVLCNIFMR